MKLLAGHRHNSDLQIISFKKRRSCKYLHNKTDPNFLSLLYYVLIVLWL